MMRHSHIAPSSSPSLARGFALKATTTLRGVFSNEAVSHDYLLRSALAAAEPVISPADALREPNDSQSTDLTTGKVGHSLQVGQRQFVRPSQNAQSIVDRAAFQSRQTLGFGERDLAPFVGDANGDGAISHLLFWSGPSAIAGFVVAVILLTIQCVPLAGALAHVGKEVLKAAPPVANGNPALAISLPSPMLRVGASFDHPAPGLIFERCFSADLVAVRCGSLAGGFGYQASATAGRFLSASELAADDRLLVSAIASAIPQVRRASPSLKRKDCEATEFAARQVFHFLAPGSVRRKPRHTTKGGGQQ